MYYKVGEKKFDNPKDAMTYCYNALLNNDFISLTVRKVKKLPSEEIFGFEVENEEVLYEQTFYAPSHSEYYI